MEVKGNLENAEEVDGIIPPSLTGEQLKAKDDVYQATTETTEGQTGTLVYVTEALTEDDRTAKTINITQTGYYVFDGEVWQMVSKEPWYSIPKNMFNPEGEQAITYEQPIYHQGNVHVGDHPGYDVYGSPTLTVRSKADADSTLKQYGLYNSFEKEKEAASGYTHGFYNHVVNKTDKTLSTTYGIYNYVNDYATTSNSGTSAYNNYYLLQNRNNTSNNIRAAQNEISLNLDDGTFQTSGSLISSYDYMNLRDISGHLITQGTLAKVAATHSFLDLIGRDDSTYKLNNTYGSLSEISISSLVNPLSYDLVNVYGASAKTKVSSRAGDTVKRLVALHSYTDLTPGNAPNFSIENVYGLLIEKNVTANPNHNDDIKLNNTYGIYIQPFTFGNKYATTSYNLYSEGLNTKNFLEGKVGIGVKNPAAKLHVVKHANDLTPAIISGCNEYTGNAAALAAGLPIGALYRTGDVLKVVH